MSIAGRGEAQIESDLGLRNNKAGSALEHSKEEREVVAWGADCTWF